MDTVSYFEINGRVYITSISSPSTGPSSFRGAPSTRIEGLTPRNKNGSGGPERSPAQYRHDTNRRWDDTWEKREQAKDDYGWGGATWKFA